MDKLQGNFEEDIKINRFKLDEDCEIQPVLYNYWSDKLTEAKGNRDKLKNEVSLTYAQTEIETRKNPPGGKVTEGLIRAAVDTNPKIVELEEKLRVSQKEVYTYEAAVEALGHRKSMLDNLVKLYGSNYFSKPEGRKDSNSDNYSQDMRGRLNKDKQNEAQ